MFEIMHSNGINIASFLSPIFQNIASQLSEIILYLSYNAPQLVNKIKYTNCLIQYPELFLSKHRGITQNYKLFYIASINLIIKYNYEF